MNRRDVLQGLSIAAAGAISAPSVLAQVVPAPAGRSGRQPQKGMSARDAVVLVTGSNRGIGLGFVKALLERGAARVYATARREKDLPALRAIDPERVRPLVLDINEPDQRAAAAAVASDVNWLINNAGVAGSRDERSRILAAPDLEDAKWVMQTNCWSPAELCRLFAPVIKANGGGAISNVLSVGAWFCVPSATSYSMSKAAAAMMTAGVRAELDRDPILVSGIYTAGVATRMSGEQGMDPLVHGHQVLDAVALGETEIISGTGAERLRDEVRSDPKAVERERIERLYAPDA